MKRPLGNKLYYTISEVAEMTSLQPYTLRAWEKEFSCLHPKRARGKNRAYRDRDIGIILLLKHLLYEERYTSQGAKQRLKNEPELVREAAGNLSTMLDRDRTGPGPVEVEGSSPAGPGPGRSQAEGDAETRAGVTEGRERPVGPSAAELRVLVAHVREELRALLDLL